MAKINTEQITSIPFLMVFVGAIFGIIGFFIAWQPDITGLDMFKNAKDCIGLDQWKCYVPLFVCGVSVIALVLALLPLFGVKLNFGILTGTLFLFGLFAIIGIAVLGLTDIAEYGQVFSKAEAGLWLSLVGSILVFAVALYNIKGTVSIVRKN